MHHYRIHPTVTIFHNIQTDEDGRPTGFFGHSEGDLLRRVYTYTPGTTSPDDQLLEEAFEMFNRDPEDFPIGAKRDLSLSYRLRELRSLSTGDVVQIDDRAYACKSVGWVRIDLNDEQVVA